LALPSSVLFAFPPFAIFQTRLCLANSTLRHKELRACMLICSVTLEPKIRRCNFAQIARGQGATPGKDLESMAHTDHRGRNSEPTIIASARDGALAGLAWGGARAEARLEANNG